MTEPESGAHTSPEGMLRITGLDAGYDGVPVIHGLSLTVGRAEAVAVMGRNGVGKSTLLRSIVGLVKPSAGSVEVDGHAIAGDAPHRIARLGIGYVPQGRGIFPKLTVKENLILGTRAVGKEGRIDEQVFAYFPILQERLRQIGGTLSGGEQQMLAIARALCGQPKVLLLDEPAEGIQPSIVKLLEALLPRIRSEAGLTVVIVEQNLELAQHTADRFLFMDKGRIVHQCDREALEDKSILRRYLGV